MIIPKYILLIFFFITELPFRVICIRNTPFLYSITYKQKPLIQTTVFCSIQEVSILYKLKFISNKYIN